MSLAKQIGSVAKTALTNAGHMSMNNEIYARISDATAAALHLEAFAPGYKECIDREAECVNRVTKSASTAQLEAKDKERDKTLQFIYSMNGSYKVCPDETLRTSALLVDSVLRAYDKIYAKAYAEAYAEETALIDGLLLDRGRYDNIQSDFSDFSRREFEAYIGKKLDRFPEDVYAWEEDGDGGWRRIDGPYFKQWIEWRASVIYDFFKRTKEELKAVKPGLKFGAYTGAWYPSYFEVGVNWASNTYDPSQDFAWATPEYKNYGYAELLDIFTNGNYYWNVTVDEYRRSNGLHKNETDSEMSKGDHLSVEGGCRYSRRLLGSRPFFGGMYVEDYKRDTTRFKRAVEMNLRESDGLMVFDIVHIINRDWWGPLQRAVSAYEAEAKQ